MIYKLKIIFYISATFSLVWLVNNKLTYDDTTIPDNFSSPIIVIAIHKPVRLHEYGAVVLRDSSGKVWRCSSQYSVDAQAIIGSYNLGDTLR